MIVNPRSIALQGVGFGALAVASLGFLLEEQSLPGEAFARINVLQDARALARGATNAALSVDEFLVRMSALDARAAFDAQSISALTTANYATATFDELFDAIVVDDR